MGLNVIAPLRALSIPTLNPKIIPNYQDWLIFSPEKIISKSQS